MFKNLSSTGQSAFSLILPLPKLVFKNWICHIMHSKENFKPQVAIFNIEISHALFVATIMQTTMSPSMTIVMMMAVDFAQSCFLLDNIKLGLMLYKASLECSEVLTLDANRRGPSLVPGAATQDDNAIVLSVLDIAPAIVKFSEHVQRDQRIRLKSAATSFKSTLGRSQLITTAVQISPGGSLTIAKSSARVRPETSCMGTLSPRIREVHRRAIKAMSDADRSEYVQQVLRLLHLTDFVLLVEFTEVIIPLDYSTLTSGSHVVV